MVFMAILTLDLAGWYSTKDEGDNLHKLQNNLLNKLGKEFHED
jgi:hypothetical protein